jgi:COMPASS component BRE2
MVAEVAPFNARVSIEDRSPHVFISKSCNIVSTEKGFRSARANVCIREGCWYFEVKILKANDGSGSHVRLGITRREASLEAPVGCDAYGYGLRDVAGEKINLSRPRQFMNESFSTGDVIGFKVYIPPRPDDDDAIDVFRDRFPIRYKGQLYYETLEYVSTKPMEELLSPKLRKKTSDASLPRREGSYVRVYKNGKDMGVAYKDLLEFMPPNSKFQPHLVTHEADDGMLGYFPTVSVFRGGMGKFNFGPDFDYEPSDNDGMQARPLSERYDEQIAEDIVYDIIDEVDFEKIDRIADEQKQNEKIKTEDQVVKEEIKREEIAGPSILPEYGDVDMPDAGPISHAAQPVHTAPESSTFGAMEDVEPSGDGEISAVELKEAEPVNEPNGDEAIVESNAKQHTDKSSQSVVVRLAQS